MESMNEAGGVGTLRLNENIVFFENSNEVKASTSTIHHSDIQYWIILTNEPSQVCPRLIVLSSRITQCIFLSVAVSGDKRDQGSPFSPQGLATPAGIGQPDVTIDTLQDDVLLEIFDSFRKIVVRHDRMWSWRTLLHVCRRWRYIVLASPRRLDLQIKCHRFLRTMKVLDHWPSHPIFIDCSSWYGPGDPVNHNIFAALQQRGRISQMDFIDIAWEEMKQFASAMGGPFPVLTRLRVYVRNDLPTGVLPDSFLGGSASRLELFNLRGSAFPALTNLVLSATHFRHLHLRDIPHAGYIPPEAMVTFLLPLHNLEGLTIGFVSPESRPLQMSPPPSTLALLPSLTDFEFDGAGEYLVDFIARIDTPMLDNFPMTLYSDIIPNISQLHKFIDRTDRLKTFTEAEVSICRWEVQAIFESGADLGLDITFNVSLTDSPLPSLLRLYEQFPTIPSQIEKLILCEESLDKSLCEQMIFLQDGEEQWECDENDPQWLEILIPFVSVKRLYVTEVLGPYIASALKNLREERVAEVFPALENLFFEIFGSSSSVEETLKSFVTRRQLSGHPVIVRRWEDDSMSQ